MHLAHRQPYLAPTSFMVCAEIRLRLAVVVLGRGALFTRLYVVAGGSASSSSHAASVEIVDAFQHETNKSAGSQEQA